MSTDIKFNAEEVLQRLAPKYMEELEEKFAQQVVKELDWSLKSKIEELTTDFFNEHIAKELEVKFNEIKPKIVEQIAIGVVKTCEALSEQMVKKSIENLSRSYVTSEIFKKLFS